MSSYACDRCGRPARWIVLLPAVPDAREARVSCSRHAPRWGYEIRLDEWPASGAQDWREHVAEKIDGDYALILVDRALRKAGHV